MNKNVKKVVALAGILGVGVVSTGCIEAEAVAKPNGKVDFRMEVDPTKDALGNELGTSLGTVKSFAVTYPYNYFAPFTIDTVNRISQNASSPRFVFSDVSRVCGTINGRLAYAEVAVDYSNGREVKYIPINGGDACKDNAFVKYHPKWTAPPFNAETKRFLPFVSVTKWSP